MVRKYIGTQEIFDTHCPNEVNEKLGTGEWDCLLHWISNDKPFCRMGRCYQGLKVLKKKENNMNLVKIVVSGPMKAGKSTIIKRIKQSLLDSGYAVNVRPEPTAKNVDLPFVNIVEELED